MSNPQKRHFRFQIDIESFNQGSAEFALEQIVMDAMDSVPAKDLHEVFECGEVVNEQFIPMVKESKGLFLSDKKETP